VTVSFPRLQDTVTIEFMLLLAAVVCTLPVRGGQGAREDAKEGAAA
jgi:hypothetical protein